jgi:hypothetical protein
MGRDATDAPRLPAFGGDNGWLYPGLAWLLERLTRLTAPRRLGLRPAATDAYVVGCTAAGVLAVVALDWFPHPPAARHALAIYVCWRLFELFSVTSFEFFVGSYRWRENLPLGRVVALKTVNLVELIVVYGLAYYLLGAREPERFGPGPPAFNTPLPSASAAVYFSVTAAATVGFGDYAPTHWATRFLACTECLFFVTVAINILGVVRSRAPLTPADHEHQSVALADRP